MPPKVHSTNYSNALIRPAPDCQVAHPKIPDKPGSIAYLQYHALFGSPYQNTSDDVLCQVAAIRKDIPSDELDAFRAEFFSKGQPCFRASPLTKTHGWAIHADDQSRIALVDPTSDRFKEIAEDPSVSCLDAMRNKRA